MLEEQDKKIALEKVVIIDDQDAERYILKDCLAGTGCTILEAANGEQGLRLVEVED